MGIFETFSRRKRRESGVLHDPLQYELVPEKLRRQVVHVLSDTLGGFSDSIYGTSAANGHWRLLHETVCKELGEFHLTADRNATPKSDTLNFSLGCTTDEWLDLMSIALAIVERVGSSVQEYRWSEYDIKQSGASAIEEINSRMREQGFGYSYENGHLVRVDSQFTHAEAVVPALSLIHEAGFKGAEQEFRAAHKNLRASNYREAISDALKSLESTIKSICDSNGWPYEKTDGSARLIAKLFDNSFIKPEMQSEFASLRSLLESGLPTVRNSTPAGHGQGAKVVEISPALATFAVNIAAVNIRYLVSTHNERRR
jgi:AbiJ N-terminal domain 4/Abortive infection C-terminus